MGIFAISDLHLPFGAFKPMDVFRGWENYTERLFINWNEVVLPSDTVVLPGDLSWALKLEDTLLDFQYLESLPGTKIISKGNHDLWWPTVKKIEDFFAVNDIKTVKLLHNNAFLVEGKAVCGSRGWYFDELTENDQKILDREALRLRTSIKEGKKLSDNVIVFLHYPPLTQEFECSEIIEVLIEEGVQRCYYGHIHDKGSYNAFVGKYQGIDFSLISSDFLKFTPKKI